MSAIELYTTPYCPYCLSDKDLLRQKGVEFTEIDVSGRPQLRAEMTARASGQTTVPQIFIGRTHVGGCDELYALDRKGKLDSMLAGEKAKT